MRRRRRRECTFVTVFCWQFILQRKILFTWSEINWMSNQNTKCSLKWKWLKPEIGFNISLINSSLQCAEWNTGFKFSESKKKKTLTCKYKNSMEVKESMYNNSDISGNCHDLGRVHFRSVGVYILENVLLSKHSGRTDLKSMHPYHCTSQKFTAASYIIFM
jgi:hypothetical protein